MNEKRRHELNNAFELLQEEIRAERESLDNQEESFSETQRWQEADEICTDAESVLDDLEEIMTRWEIR